MTESTNPAPHQIININTPQEDRKTNHLLHLVLTVLTGGLWLPVWITVRIARGK